MIAINGLIFLMMLFFLLRKLLAWSLALPLILFSSVSPADSFFRSESVAQGHKREIFKVFAIWALAAALLSSVALGSIHFLGSKLAPHFYDSLDLLVLVMGGLVALLSLANLFVTTFTSGSLASMVVILSERYGTKINISDLTVREEGAGWRSTSFKAALLLTGGSIAAVFIGTGLLKDIQTVDHVEVIAHRGAAGKAPENTIASMRQAVKDNADWVEIDVQETKDGEVVVIHDSDFMKLSGVSTKVWEGTLAQLRQIDMGGWFDPKFSSERIPTLEEVLMEVKGKAKVLIELKYYGHDEKLEQRVVDIVEKADMAENVALMSLKPAGIKKLRTLRPDWETGILLSKAIGDISKMDVDFLAVNMGVMKPSFVRTIHQAGKKAYIWTADDPVSMTSMISLGVDGIITNEPEMARKVLTERAKLGTIERLLLHTAVLLGEPVPKRLYRDDSP
jgi:glycerophosphoryl diester phosphodiesterase